MPSLANRVSPSGNLCAYDIGQAAASLKRDPEKWKDRGDFAFVLQELKLLWHVLVKYGVPSA